jgi:hypothetical protein
MKDIIYEHLNNKRLDNRLENLALSHQSCNIKKVTLIDYQIIANEQLKKNEDLFYLREKIEDKMPTDTSTEIQINQSNYEIVEQFITERINTDNSIPYQDALDACVYKCKSTTGHGSQQSVRNYIATLTSIIGPFMIVKDDCKKKTIVRRSGN